MAHSDLLKKVGVVYLCPADDVSAEDVQNVSLFQPVDAVLQNFGLILGGLPSTC